MSDEEKTGERIDTLHELRLEAMSKRSVICIHANCFNKPMPAAFVMNMSGTYISRLLHMGLFQYIPKNKRGLR